MRYVAIDRRGRELALLEGVRDFAHAFDEAVIKGRVPGAVNVIGDNAYSDGDIKMAEARLIAAFQENGLTEKEAKVAARGRDRDRPIRDFLPTIRVPRQGATAGSSSTAARISEGESQERDRRSLDLREPTWSDRVSELTELEELGAISEGTQDMGAEIPTAYAMLMSYPQPDGTTTAQWRIRCPLCGQIHFSPRDSATLDDPTNLLGEQAMLCRQGIANVVDAATNPPPDPAGQYANAIAKTEAARAEAALYEAFLRGGLSPAEAKIAARGRR